MTRTSTPAAVIPDALPPGPGTPQSVSDTLAVTHGGTIADVDVGVTLRHPAHGDLSIDLTAPGGATVRLINTEGGPGDGLANVVFDDEAAALPPGFVVDGTCLVDRTYRPAPGSLSAFDGLDARGNWTLTVADHFSGDAADCDCDVAVVGPACPRTLEKWSLTFELAGGDDDVNGSVLTCREALILIGIIVGLLVILLLLVSKTRP